MMKVEKGWAPRANDVYGGFGNKETGEEEEQADKADEERCSLQRAQLVREKMQRLLAVQPERRVP